MLYHGEEHMLEIDTIILIHIQHFIAFKGPDQTIEHVENEILEQGLFYNITTHVTTKQVLQFYIIYYLTVCVSW